MNDSIKRTLLVTLSVCLICSLFVSITAVSLRSTQETNKLNDQRIKILIYLRSIISSDNF